MSFDEFSLLAHRGCSSLAPENTLASFKAASIHGATGVELDVALLNDGTAVVFHDDEVNRCTNGSGLLCEFTFDQLHSLDAGSWFSPRFKDEPVPTLNETLRLLTELKLDLNLEIKPYAGNEKALVDQINAVIDRYPVFSGNNLLFSSLDYQALKYLRSVRPQARIAILYDGLPPQTWHKDVTFIQAEAININAKYAKKMLIEQIKAAGIKTYVWTVNELEKGTLFKKMDVNGIITDCPQIFSSQPLFKSGN